MLNNLTIGLITLCVTTSCGSIKYGMPSSDDPAPDGTVVYSGTFAANSNSISGTVYVYLTTSITHTVRLTSFSTTSTTNRVVKATASSGETPLYESLKSTGGNQNYALTSQITGSLVSVTIESAVLSPPDNVLATALLQPLGQ